MMLLIKSLLFLAIIYCPFYSSASDITILSEANREAKVKIYLDEKVVEFKEFFWTNEDISNTTYEVYPKKILRVRAKNGEALLVIPDMEKSNDGSLYFLLDDGKSIKKIFRPRPLLTENHSEVFLFDIDDNGVNDFIIQWADESFFRFEVYSIQATAIESSQDMPIIFSSHVLEYPRKQGIDVFSIRSDKLCVRYNYKNMEKVAQVRVNPSDPSKEPYLYPVGIK